MAEKLPIGLLRRAASTGRIAAHLGRAAARRLAAHATGASTQGDDAHLGDRLFQELDKLKGLAMKVGQILSYMEVGLPEETTQHLARLQHGVEPLPFSVVAAEIASSLGAPATELYDRFDPVPIAAASIGQVHRASLRGVEVAVKIRYPGVRETLLADTRQLSAIAKIASLATAVDGHALVAELRARLLEECDYSLEAQNQLLFSSLLAPDPRLVVPRVHLDRCSPSVLTSDWISASPFSELLTQDRSRKNAVAHTMMRLPWSTLLHHHVLHADPHPGNYLFPDGDRVVVLDFGCIRRFSPAQIADFHTLVSVVLADRRDQALDAAVAVGLAPHPDRIDVEELWQMLVFLMAPYRVDSFHFTRPWWEENMARFSSPTARNGRHMGFPPEWMWLQRSLIGLHAVLLKLDAVVEAGPLLHDLLAPPHAHAV